MTGSGATEPAGHRLDTAMERSTSQSGQSGASDLPDRMSAIAFLDARNCRSANGPIAVIREYASG